MKKKPLVITAMAVIFIFGAVIAYMVLSSRNLSPAGSATYSYDGLDLRVDYYRPSKRGRVIFGDEKDGALQPNGQYWRLGANDATEITFNKDITFAGKPVKAGSYRMYANLGEATWAISLNSELGAYGASEPKHDLDVLSVDVPVEKAPSVTEQFTISFDNDSTGVNMNLDWDLVHLRVPIRVQ